MVSGGARLPAHARVPRDLRRLAMYGGVNAYGRGNLYAVDSSLPTIHGLNSMTLSLRIARTKSVSNDNVHFLRACRRVDMRTGTSYHAYR